jgi:hypothetical protein
MAENHVGWLFAAGGPAASHKFFIVNCPVRRSEINSIFRDTAMEAIDRPPLYMPAGQDFGISFCTAARNRVK